MVVNNHFEIIQKSEVNSSAQWKYVVTGEQRPHVKSSKQHAATRVVRENETKHKTVTHFHLPLWC